MSRRLSERAAAVVLATTMMSALAVVVVEPVPPKVHALTPQCSLCGGGEYHPLTPARIFDSRPESAVNDVEPFGKKPTANNNPSTAFDVVIVGEPGDPIAESLPGDAITTADVLAVIVNITIVAPTSRGNLMAYPAGSTPSTPLSILNFRAGQTVPNMAVVRPGVDGKLTIRINTVDVGTAHVLIDVFGWFSTSAFDAGTPYDDTDDTTSLESQLDERGSRLIPVSPGRILDTRPAEGGAGPIGQAASLELQIRGADTIKPPLITDIVPPGSDVTGVLLNITAVFPSKSTFIALLPEAPVGAPETSNLNLTPGLVRANLVAVPVGADGKVRIYNNAGSVNVVADVVGYFVSGRPEETRAGRVVPLTAPFRAFDTREIPFGQVPLGPGQAEIWSFADFADSVNIGGTAVGEQLGLIGNLTSASLSRQYPTVPVTSFLTAYPADAAARPGSSNLNNTEGAAIPNMVVLVYGTAVGKQDQITVYNNRGYTHYLFDVSAVILADAPTT